MKRITIFTAAIAVLLTAAPADAKLSIGDKAPQLKVDKWVKGEPVKLADLTKKKNVVVVEFWASWCFPCVMSMPHLTELQHKYADKGLVAIGMTSKDDRNSLAAVEKFVKDQGKQMDFRVAFEEKDATYAAYMTASGQEGIPTAFVIDQAGRLAWLGHPMAGLDEVVHKIIEGKFDIKVAKQTFELEQKIVAAAAAEQWDTVVENADKLTELNPANGTAWQLKFHAYAIVLNKPDEARAAGHKAVEAMKTDADWLNGFAWTLLTELPLRGNYNKLALAAAEACHKASGGQDWMYLDTLALAKFETGDAAEAVELEKKAIKLCTMQQALPDMEATLKRFEAGVK